jgi:hypothetical protein
MVYSMNQIQTNMKTVIDFIIEQGLDISDYPKLVPLLKEKFNIKNYYGQEATEELVNTVIFWEKHTEIYDSLEKTLNNKFLLS